MNKVYNFVWDTYEERLDRMTLDMAFNLTSMDMTIQIINKLKDMMGVTIPTYLSFIEDEHDRGGWSQSTNTISINLFENPIRWILEDNLDRVTSCLENICHELRHAWQQENNRGILDNYISPEEDMDGYLNHPCEVDAREFASEFIKDLDVDSLF